MLHKWFGRYFTFSSSELQGVALLMGCLLLLGVITRVYPLIIPDDEKDITIYVQEIEDFLATAVARELPVDAGLHAAGGSVDASDVPMIPAPEYFNFDPNDLSIVDWKRLGLSERQIQTIKNYEAKGGRFRRKEDLKRIYSISDADYARLEGYIEIPQTVNRPIGAEAVPASGQTESGSRTYNVQSSPFGVPLELNSADSLALQRLPGIGPVYASRIVRFRDLLGGFHDVSQLLDVYGFDSVRFEGMRKGVYVDTAQVRKIALNTADYDLLQSHPFISNKLANAILQYRKQHGPYRSITDLMDIVLMDENIFRKIAPYLTLSHD